MEMRFLCSDIGLTFCDRMRRFSKEIWESFRASVPRSQAEPVEVAWVPYKYVLWSSHAPLDGDHGADPGLNGEISFTVCLRVSGLAWQHIIVQQFL